MGKRGTPRDMTQQHAIRSRNARIRKIQSTVTWLEMLGAAVVSGPDGSIVVTIPKEMINQ